MSSRLETAINASIEAGKEVLEVYNSDFIVETKEDRSPLTLADKNAHACIMRHLAATGLPVLSEEGSNIPYDERKNWDVFWMVDPLDGTKEFVKRNGEFTVNIALISHGNPTAGVIYVPVKEILYFGSAEHGAHKCVHNISEKQTLTSLLNDATTLPVHEKKAEFVVVASRSHMSKETEDFIAELKKEHRRVEVTSIGSSLKICLVAEGVANIYPRFAPTMEWDTAAGHAIVKASGKEIYDYTTSLPMKYNKENLLNNCFVAK